LREVLSANLYRGSTETVSREDARYAGTRVQQDHGEVLAVGLADTCFSDTDADTRNGMEVGRLGSRQIDRHERLSMTPGLSKKRRGSTKNGPKPVLTPEGAGIQAS
jgi:hypothetical protein